LALEAQQRELENPTPTQEETGGGKDKKTKAKDSMLGDRKVMGFNIVIEHERGDVRYGARLPAAYGYIRRTDSAERGDQMDCFVGSELLGLIFIVDSYEPVTGKFDEHKIMLAVANKESALAIFRAYYNGFPDAPARRIGKCNDPVTPDELTRWLATGDVTRPFYEPTNVQYAQISSDPEAHRCRTCAYFDSGICSNRVAYFDPRVPETYDGMKMVSPSGGCTQYEPMRVTETEMAR
jgi:hypothetical protein